MRNPSRPNLVRPRARIAVFGSFYRGYFVLNELLYGELSTRVEVVGVATDNPSNCFISASRRVWQYPHTEQEENMVHDLAQSRGLDVYRERINDDAFHQRFEQEWRPDLCIMATFGQKITARTFGFPALGFFNLHPCTEDGWPSRYAGGNPFQALRANRETHTKIAMHWVDEGFDTGKLLAYSQSVAIPPSASVTDMHKITAVTAAALAVREIRGILDRRDCLCPVQP